MRNIASTRKNRRGSTCGFSLIELLCVVAIMSLLIGASGLVASNAGGESQMVSDTYKLADLIQQVKATAIAQNTYVWMALSSDVMIDGNQYLCVAVQAAKNGQSADWTASVRPLTKMVSLRNLTLNKDIYSRLTERSSMQPSTVDVSNCKWATITLVPPGSKSPVEFKNIIAFGPDGEIRIDPTTPNQYLGIGLQSVTKNFAAGIQITGLSGQVAVYR